MKEWLTAREIAAEQLSNELPTTEYGVQLMAAREGWNNSQVYCRKRAGRGGGLEYHINLLPTLARIEYERRYRAIERVEPKPAPELVLGNNLTERAACERDARIAILSAFEGFSKGRREAVETQLFMFSNQYNMGSLKVPDWVRNLIPSISKRTMHRWRTAKFVGRVDRLAVDRGAARKGKGLLQTANGGAVELAVLGWLGANPLLSAQVIRGYIEEEFGPELTDAKGNTKPLPPVRTFQQFIAYLREEKHVALTKATNPDKYRSTHKLRGTGAYSWVTTPNFLWMIDASPVDALCVDGRWSLYAAIDVATRRAIITLSRTPRASAVCLMLRKAILAWGVPKRIKTDNGSDFKAAETQRLLKALDIDADPADAYCPDQKAFIERMIGTFQHEVGPQLPGFVGHNVTDRKAIEDRKSFATRLGESDAQTFAVSLTAAQLQTHIDEWLTYVYNRRDHGTIGISPDAAAAASIEPIARVDERALDVLLMPVAGKDGRRRVTAQGIRIDRHYYLSHSILVGTDVFVRLDPINMGRIYVFDADDGRYLDVAECAALMDVDRPAFVKAKKELYESMVSEETQRIRKETRRHVSGKSGISRTIDLAKRKAAATDASNNVIPLPKREIEHTTPAIEAARQVSAPAPPKELSGRAAEILKEAQTAEPITVTRSANVTPLRTQETRHQRYARAQSIERAMEVGEAIPAEEAKWYAYYSGGSEYRAMRKTYGVQVSS